MNIGEFVLTVVALGWAGFGLLILVSYLDGRRK